MPPLRTYLLRRRPAYDPDRPSTNVKNTGPRVGTRMTLPGTLITWCLTGTGRWGDVLLWEIRQRIELREGQALFFRGGAITLEYEGGGKLWRFVLSRKLDEGR